MFTNSTLKVVSETDIDVISLIRFKCVNSPHKNEYKKKAQSKMIELRVPTGGIEPPLTCVNWILNPARLPIPPHRQLSLL